MIVLSGALVLVALVLLVFGAVDRNLPYVYASIGVSLLSLLLLLVGIVQRRGELTGEEQDDATTPVTDTTDERVPALAGAGAQVSAPVEAAPAPAVLPVAEPQPASRRVVPDAAPAPEPVADEAFEDEPVQDEADELDADDDEVEDDELEDDEPAGSGVTVLVVSGRPRYHLEGCRVLRGKEPQPLDRDDARMHGFTPCGVCKPDADETAAQPEPDDASQTADDASFTETLFGGPLFADSPPAEAPAQEPERVETSALPDRPVQPVLAEVDRPAAPVTDQAPADREADEAPAELRGDDPADDPADDPTFEVHDAPVEPAPDVAADRDELPELEDAPAAEAPVEQEVPPVVEAPVLEPVVDERPLAEPPQPVVEEDAPVGAPSELLAGDGPADPLPVEAPARTAATKKAPAKKAPAKKPAAKKAPAKKAPARKPAAEGAAAAPPVEAPAAPKRPLVRAVRADALRLGAPSAGSTTTRVSARAAAPASAPPVVVVPERDRFHRPECRYVRGVAGATTLPKASATRQGYAPCGVCKP